MKRARLHMGFRMGLAIAAWGLVWAFQGCIGNSPQSYGFASPDDGVGATASKSLDANGGVLAVGSGAATLNVPAGALSGNTALSVTIKDRALSPNATALGSQVFDFGPDGTQFTTPVTLQLQSLDPPPTGSRATLAFLNAQQAWQVVPNSTYDGTNQTVTGAVSHFTDFAVYWVNAQGTGCVSSPDPAAFCSPDVCDIGHNICVPAGTISMFNVGGTLTGLAGGTLVLNDNGGDALNLTADGNFVFATALDDNTAYRVSVAQQPNNQWCDVAAGAGMVAGADVTSVAVTCVPTFAVGGSVTGLTGSASLVLQNGNDRVAVTASQPNFVIDRLTAGSQYQAFVATSAAGHQCVVAGGNGVVGQADVQSIHVACSPLDYAVGGRVTGLVASAQVTLQNGSDSITVGNGNFMFPQSVAFGATFSATLASPAGETCVFSNSDGSGTVGAANVTTVVVACTPNTYALGGTIAGLVGQTQATLTQGADSVTMGNGIYTFPTAVAFGASWQITSTSPAGQTCRFGDGNTWLSGTMPAASITDANLTCVPATYSVGGMVTGLVGGGTVSLQNGSDAIAVGNGSYAFPTPVAYGGTYNASLTSPTGQTCSFTAGHSGTVGSVNVTSVGVSCSPQSYTLGGTVSGLVGNNEVTLQNGRDSATVSNGAYTFATSVAYASSYSATLTSPAGQTCNFSPAGSQSGTMGAGNVTSVNVVCGTKTYSLGGTISGLVSGTTVTLNDGTDNINAGNGSFTFPTGLAYGNNWSVSLTAPSGQSCAFSGPSNGTMGAANVTSLSVSCTPLPYTLGGTVSGLIGNTEVALRNGQDSFEAVNGTYTFATSINYGAPYNASLTSPQGQTCVFVDNPNAGTMPAANITSLDIACTPQTFSVGGTVSGLLSGTTVGLQDGTDNVSLGNGPFTFPTALGYDTNFTVAVNQPTGQQCSVSGTQSGPMPAQNITDLSVSCSTLSYTLGGSVSGLMYNGSVGLQNGSDILSVGNGVYTFPSQVAYTNDFNVILRSPGGQACIFTTDNNGTMPAQNVTNVNIACQLVPYSLSVAAPGTVVTANMFSASISVLDLEGNVLTGYTGTILFSSSDPSGTPNTAGQNIIFDGTDQGVVTVNNLQLTTLGSQMLFANDAVDNVQGEAAINVTSMFMAEQPESGCGSFATGVQAGEPGLLSATRARVQARHATLWPPGAAAGLRVAAERGGGVAGSDAFVAFAGVGAGPAPGFAMVDAFDVGDAHIVLHEDAYLSYWVRPGATATGAAVNLIFDDGSDSFSAPPADTTGYAVHPEAQARRLEPGIWNHVQVPLAAFAGRRVRRLAFGWQHDGRDVAFETRFDAVRLVGADCRSE